MAKTHVQPHGDLEAGQALIHFIGMENQPVMPTTPDPVVLMPLPRTQACLQVIAYRSRHSQAAGLGGRDGMHGGPAPRMIRSPVRRRPKIEAFFLAIRNRGANRVCAAP